MAIQNRRERGEYHLGAGSLPQDGMAKGKLERPFLFKGRILKTQPVSVIGSITSGRRRTYRHLRRRNPAEYSPLPLAGLSEINRTSFA
jgi:hypothetical protein